LEAADWFLEDILVISESDIVTMACSCVLFELEVVSTERLRLRMGVGSNFDVALVIGFQLVVGLDVRRELNAVGDLVKFLHIDGRLGVTLGHIDVLSAVVDGRYLVSVGLSIDESEQPDLVVTVRASVQTEADVLAESSLIIKNGCSVV